MKAKVQVYADRKQLGIAGGHSVLLDRGIEQGGEDAGFRSAELWLIAISGCISGSLNAKARQQGIEQAVLLVESEDLTDASGQITHASFAITFAAHVDAGLRSAWLTEVRQTCKMLRTVGEHIQIALTDKEASAAEQARSEVAAGCSVEDGSCCI